MTADIGTVLLLLDYQPTPVHATRIMRGFIWGVVGVALVAWCTPTMDDFRLGNEDFFHPNEIGFVLAIATLLAMCLARKNKAWKWVAAGLAITLLRDLSKASIAAFLLAALFYLMQGSTFSRNVRLQIGIGATLVVASFWTVLEAYADVYSQGNNVETLTGRTVIWATSFEIALEKPWLGHGFYSYRWAVPPLGNFAPMQAHNELLQQFFTYGIAGVIALIALYWSFYRQIRSTPASRFTTLAGALLVFAVVRGLVDTERFDLSYPLWLIALLSMVLANTRAGELT
jgi:O-antigen ligase